MLSALIPSAGRQPAVPLAGQLAHESCVRPGPLVLGTAFLKSPTATADRDRTVSRRSKPSSRTALMGEQPNLGTYFSPRMRRADIEVPNLPVDVDSWGRSACYPRGSFYPLSDGPPTRYHRITKSDFRPCSTCRCRSQAPFCLCTLRAISNRAEGTFGRLRYFFGGDRPSQTAHLTMSATRIYGVALEAQNTKGGISRMTPRQPKPPVHSLPPILSGASRTPISSCSKGSRGLSV